MNRENPVVDYTIKYPSAKNVVVGAFLIVGFGMIFVSMRDLWVGPSEADRRAADERVAAGEALDATEGFTRIDGRTTDVAVYRDNKTGCEWISRDGRSLKERTAPDAQGVSRQVCQAGSTGHVPASSSE